jgi:hypothetical protein
MDEIEKRLRDAADNCIKHFSAWQKDKKMGADRDSLLESIHELRKVAARLEIDIAVSERTEMGARALPIPPHRSSGRRGPGDDNIGNEAADDSFGNQQPDDSGHQQPRSNAGRDPRRPQGGSHGGPRRQGGGGGRPQG